MRNVREDHRVRHTGQDNPRLLDVAASAVGLQPVFQPVVSLPGGETVGFEALARWPASPNADPQTVFARAAATGRLDHLDRMCVQAAVDEARLRLGPGSLLMVNCEPATGYDYSPAVPTDDFHVMFELTERSLLGHPHALLRKVAGLRADGFFVALDDVGAHPDSLALLDILRPDVIKLDLHLIQSQPGDGQARTLAAVLAHQERTGSVLLAEGIESDDHLEQALALGATLGQGYMFGRPAPLDGQTSVGWSRPPTRNFARWDCGSPFDMVAGRSTVRTARKQTLMALTRNIETQARHESEPPMVLAALQRVENFTGVTRDRYCRAGGVSPLVAIFGRGVPCDLGEGVRGVDLDPADPLCAEWTVVILGPHHAAALIAREHDGTASGFDGDRRFDFTITYDRALVTLAARNMLDRIV